jgi:cytochrome c5
VSRFALVAAALFCGWSGALHPQSSPPGTDGAPPFAASDAALAAFPPHRGRDVVVRACAPCHAPELVVAKRRSADDWDRIILAMVDRGAVADEAEQQQILDYLVELFGPGPGPEPDAPPR